MDPWARSGVQTPVWPDWSGLILSSVLAAVPRLSKLRHNQTPREHTRVPVGTNCCETRAGWGWWAILCVGDFCYLECCHLPFGRLNWSIVSCQKSHCVHIMHKLLSCSSVFILCSYIVCNKMSKYEFMFLCLPFEELFRDSYIALERSI